MTHGATFVIAVAAAGVAVVALALAAVLAWRLSRVRSDQRAVLGGQDARDLVGHAAGLQREFGALSSYLEDVAARLDERLGNAERRLDGAVAHRSLVRYDAYGELSGHQSMSIALLDASRSGIVLSSIHHRDHARLYAKLVHGGRPDVELSPEEQEAVALALGRPPASAPASATPPGR